MTHEQNRTYRVNNIHHPSSLVINKTIHLQPAVLPTKLRLIHPSTNPLHHIIPITHLLNNKFVLVILFRISALLASRAFTKILLPLKFHLLYSRYRSSRHLLLEILKARPVSPSSSFPFLWRSLERIYFIILLYI
jgi:hypothetical protein